MEINWSELVIFAIVIIANIIGGIVKINQKKKQKQLAEQYNAPQADTNEYFEDEFFSDIPEKKATPSQQRPPAPTPVIQENTAKTPVEPSNIQIEELDDEDSETFDYSNFMRKHGREAFILAEIVLPPNSRQG